MSKRKKSLFDPKIVRAAVKDSFRKLHPRVMVRNPVMFVVYIGSFLATGLFVQALAGQGEAPAGFILAVALWLWFTVLFANFAEAVAEGSGQGAGRGAAADAQDHERQEAAGASLRFSPHRGRIHGAEKGRRRPRRGRRHHPRRR